MYVLKRDKLGNVVNTGAQKGMKLENRANLYLWRAILGDRYEDSTNKIKKIDSRVACQIGAHENCSVPKWGTDQKQSVSNSLLCHEISVNISFISAGKALKGDISNGTRDSKIS